MSSTLAATPKPLPAVSLKEWARETFVYSPLAFAETAESIQQVQDILQVGEGDTVAGITSAGDVFLSLLAKNPRQVWGFDYNPAQTAIASLKKELFRRRDAYTYKSLLGLLPSNSAERWKVWSELKPHLAEHATRIERLALEEGILNHGASAWISRMIDLGLKLSLSTASYRKLLAPETSLEERLSIFDEVKQSRLNRSLLGPILRQGRAVFQYFFFPPFFCSTSDYPRRALMDAVELARPMFQAGFADNPVVSRHITGRIPSEHERLLFSPSSWSRIRANVDRIDFQTAPLDQGLDSLPACSVDAIYLSNAVDYLKKDGLTGLAGRVRRVAKPGARVFYLSLDIRCPFEAHGVETPWKLDKALADRSMAEDTVGVYRYLGAGRFP